MNIATVPPGGVASAHVHVGFEVMLYILQGSVRHEFGDRLRQSVDNGAGDFIYIEPGVPHEVFNLSDTEPVVAVVARSDADEWSHIVAYRSRHRSDGRRCPADEVVRTHAWSSLKSPSARGQAGRGERRPDSSASASRMKWRHYGRTDPSVRTDVPRELRRRLRQHPRTAEPFIHLRNREQRAFAERQTEDLHRPAAGRHGPRSDGHDDCGQSRHRADRSCPRGPSIDPDPIAGAPSDFTG